MTHEWTGTTQGGREYRGWVSRRRGIRVLNVLVGGRQVVECGLDPSPFKRGRDITRAYVLARANEGEARMLRLDAEQGIKP